MSLTLQQIHCRCVEYGDCLLWNQSCTPNGYPRVKGGYAHIFAWEAVHGSVPAGMLVRRKCDEVRCCNVDHMVLMTRRQQNLLAVKSGAWKNPARIAAITLKARQRSKLQPPDIALIRASELSGVELARQFNVSRSLISRIRLRKSWMDAARNSSVFNQAA